MKRTLPLAVIAAVVLGLAFMVTSPSNAGDRDGAVPGPPIAKMIGAWLYVIDFGNGPFEGELQLFADGNAIMNNTVLNGGASHLTTALGSWKRTGLKTGAVTCLIRIVNEDGELLSYEKVVGELTVEGNIISGEGAGLIYLPSQDPLDPDEVPVLIYGPSTLVGQRIGIQAVPQ